MAFALQFTDGQFSSGVPKERSRNLSGAHGRRIPGPADRADDADDADDAGNNLI